MKYNPPYGASDADAPYVNATPGQKGSPVPAEAIEYTQREIVNVIIKTGYTPSNANLSQLYQAIQSMVQSGTFVLKAATASVLGGVKISKGGLEISAAGLLSLMLDPEGGLGLDVEGRLYVRPDAFSKEIVEEMLRALRLPVWLAKSTVFYVRADGNDNNDGLADTASRAFRTIQGALNSVSENYNFGRYVATIRVGSGVFDACDIPKYNCSTGHLILEGAGVGSIIQVTDESAVDSTAAAGTFYVRNFQMNLNMVRTDTTLFLSAVHSKNGNTCYPSNLLINVNEGADVSSSARVMTAQGGGSMYFGDGIVVNCNGKASGSRITPIFLSGGQAQMIGHGAVMTINGIGNAVLSANSQSSFSRNGAYSPLPVFAGNFSGIRCTAAGLSYVNTSGVGQELFPGTSDGAIQSGSILA